MSDQLLISADSHFLDPPDMWTEWLPRKYWADAPQLVDDGAGGHGWLFAGSSYPEPIGLAALPGLAEDRLRPVGVRYEEARPGTYSGSGRLVDQAEDGVTAEVIFPTSRPMSQFLDSPDRDLVMAGVRAYNRFVTESFCAADPSRLHAVGQLPTTGTSDCIEVLTECVDLGCVATVLPCWPSGDSKLSFRDAPFWEAASDLGRPVCIHVGLTGREDRLLLREYRSEFGGMPSKPPVYATATERTNRVPLEYHHGVPSFADALGRSASALSELLMSGVFDAFPKLKVVLAETWVGWIPRALEACDDIWFKNRYWRDIPLERAPSTYWSTNVAGTFIRDRAGLALADMLNPSNIMWSSDYPHFGTSWPNSKTSWLSDSISMRPADRTCVAAMNAVQTFGIPVFW